MWVGDVGWSIHEEVNRIADVDDSVVENFGWPCYEGPGPQPRSYDTSDLPICEGLYDDAERRDEAVHVVPPRRGARHRLRDGWLHRCRDSRSTTEATYPAGYSGVLFAVGLRAQLHLDDAQGLERPARPEQRRLFAQASSPVDLEIGPGGDLFYVSYWEGTVRRFVHVDNRTPIAHIAANPTSGPSPLTVEFDGQGSVDPDEAEILTYAWDLDGDGEFDDGNQQTASWTYPDGGVYTPALKVTDRAGASSTATTTITVDNDYPEITSDAPSPESGVVGRRHDPVRRRRATDAPRWSAPADGDELVARARALLDFGLPRPRHRHVPADRRGQFRGA